MPGCVLRVAGSKEKIKKFLSSSSFNPEAVYFRGERKSEKSVWRNSGFNLLLSSAKSIQKQAAGAVVFMTSHKREFDRMKAIGLTKGTIDFGFNDISSEDHPWPTYKLPASLIALAAAYDCEIVLSFYGKR